MGRIGIVADIKQPFLQIFVDNNDRDLIEISNVSCGFKTLMILDQKFLYVILLSGVWVDFNPVFT